ncbi:MAG: DUF3445 domain-containing protein [Jannaschia sp.]
MEITQQTLPFTPWADPALARMPGLRPVVGGWIVVDEVYGAQLAAKARLLAEHRHRVLQVLPRAEDAAGELLKTVLGDLPSSFQRHGAHVTRPDGVTVGTDGPPFEVLSRLVQEDLLILERDGAEHILTAGLLCFPASWTLTEKIGRPLTRIHAPVHRYDADIALRVQRLFDRVQPGRPMWRANTLGYARADLFQPMTEAAPRDPGAAPARFLRSERQTVMRLPMTGSVVFAVHTWVVPFDRLTPEQQATCPVL